MMENAVKSTNSEKLLHFVQFLLLNHLTICSPLKSYYTQPNYLKKQQHNLNEREVIQSHWLGSVLLLKVTILL